MSGYATREEMCRMISPTTFKTPNHILYGADSVERLAEILEWFKCRKPVVISDPGVVQAGITARVLDVVKKYGADAEVYTDIESDPDIRTADRCGQAVKAAGCDFIVAVGGGSALDIAKAASILATNGGKAQDYLGIERVPGRGLPKAMIPTTAGTGSEVTNVCVLSLAEHRTKKGIVSRHLFADAAIIDPGLMVSLPPRITASTGMDALTHAIEAYLSRFSTPWTDLYAIEAVSLVGRHLRKAVVDGGNLDAREKMAMASCYAGLAFGNAATGMVHGIAMSLGGQFHIPHGVANAVMLPFVMEWNSVSRLEKYSHIAAAMGEPIREMSPKRAAERAVQAVRELSVDIGIPQHLRELGIKREDLETLAKDAMTNSRQIAPNPRDVTFDEVMGILQRAF
jgi:alcohol dehydrogenase